MNSSKFAASLFSVAIFSIGWQGISMPAVQAQEDPCVTYKFFDKTFYREEPVTEYRWEEKEVMETSYKKKWVPVYQTEMLEKKSVSYRPVRKTSEREERYKVVEPVTVTKYREKETQETTYETDIEMREEEYVTRRPVIETVMQEKDFTVREKVTQQSYEYRDVTTLKPTTVEETSLVPVDVIVPGMALPTRPRMRWLSNGYYTDPGTGLTTYRRRGLHWTVPNSAPPVVSGLVPQTSSRLAYVPETVTKKEPIEISRYVDRVETRKVPVEVKRMEERVETRKVPVEVRRPKTVTRVEKIPYTETSYRETEKVRRVPVVEEVMQKVETIEPVEKTTAKWVEKEEAIETPKIVRRRVPYTTTRRVPYRVRMRVAVDSYGNAIGEPEPVNPRDIEFIRDTSSSSNSRSSTNRPSDSDLKSVLEDSRDRRPASFNVDDQSTTSPRSPAAADTTPSLSDKSSSETSGRSSGVRSILDRGEEFPETVRKFEPRTSLNPLGGEPVRVEVRSGDASRKAIETSQRKSTASNDSEDDFIQTDFSHPRANEHAQDRYEGSFSSGANLAASKDDVSSGDVSSGEAKTLRETGARQQGNTTTRLKPAIEFDPGLIRKPSIQDLRRPVRDMQKGDLDNVDGIERRNISEIY